jgi:hypothetical protein
MAGGRQPDSMFPIYRYTALPHYWIAPRGQIVMLTVFRKSELKDLTRTDIKSWAAVVKKLKS